MKIVTGSVQDQYWKRVGYRSSDNAVVRAFSLPKLRFISQYVDLADASILDVGCGTGAFSGAFAEISPHVVGLDYSAHMLVRNPVKARLRGRAEALPFKDAAFDVVFAANLLHHSDVPERIVAEAVRVSRRHVVLVEPNRVNLLMLVFSLLVRAERGGLRSSKGFLTRILRQQGCRVTRCAAMGMISENKTPAFLLPLLQPFDREIFWGEYLVAIGEKA